MSNGNNQEAGQEQDYAFNGRILPHASTYLLSAILSTTRLGVFFIRFRRLPPDEVFFQRTLDIPALVLPCALLISLIQKYILIADAADFEW